MVYEIFDKLPNVTIMINCLITRKQLNLTNKLYYHLIGNSLLAIKWNYFRMFSYRGSQDMIPTDQKTFP